MLRQKVFDVGAFYVAIGNSHNKVSVVAIELPQQGLGCAAIEGFLGCDMVGQVGKIFVAIEHFFCCDRVWQNEEVLCCNREILCPDIIGQAG